MASRRLFFVGFSLLIGFFLITFLNDVHAFGVKKKRPKLHEYGNVVLNNFSIKANFELQVARCGVLIRSLSF